jgi:hypothetical protein
MSKTRWKEIKKMLELEIMNREKERDKRAFKKK